MKKSMLELLACPIDKHYPLELFEINIKEDKDNEGAIITDGILFCNKCYRFYPIIDEIPVLLPDELREKQKDIDFLHKWYNKIPSKVINEANPWHI
ncbi:MAG TPA: Trm112 family protein [Nitrososphaeraceae archaeon]|nr:Trm112 family protein [Nitrososphaeraceae archaeon]